MAEPRNSEELLNTALALATEWGENFRKPIHERIRIDHPELTDAEIDELTEIARKAEYRIYELTERQNDGSMSSSEVYRTTKSEFPWISDENFRRLNNIGMYYANR